MNVSKIKSLSEQHVELKIFYDDCCKSGVALHIVGGSICTRELTQKTTAGILLSVRTAILRRITGIEAEIKAEISK